MGYINPVSYVEQVGRPLRRGPGRANGYLEVAGQLGPGEQLVAVLDKAIFKAAPIIPNDSEFREMYGVYASGEAISIYFYALTDQQIAEHS